MRAAQRVEPAREPELAPDPRSLRMQAAQQVESADWPELAPNPQFLRMRAAQRVEPAREPKLAPDPRSLRVQAAQRVEPADWPELAPNPRCVLVRHSSVCSAAILAPTLEVLSLFGCKFDDLPQEVCGEYPSENALDKVRAHYEDLKAGQHTDAEIKVLFLGNGGVGKRSFAFACAICHSTQKSLRPTGSNSAK
jgi:hypothetical protein